MQRPSSVGPLLDSNAYNLKKRETGDNDSRQGNLPIYPIASTNFPIVSTRTLRPIIMNGPENLAQNQFIDDLNSINRPSTLEAESLHTTQMNNVEGSPNDPEKLQAAAVTLPVGQESGSDQKAEQLSENSKAFDQIEANFLSQTQNLENYGHKLPFAELNLLAKHQKGRLWNPTSLTNLPSETEFKLLEVSFGRFIHFYKNRLAAGLSEDAVRLLSRYYNQIDDPSIKELLTLPERPEILGGRVDVKRRLDNRQLIVLINLLMLLIESEQKKVQLYVAFTELLNNVSQSTTESDTAIVANHVVNNDDNPKNLLHALTELGSQFQIELLALCQEHIKLLDHFLTEIKAVRGIMVRCNGEAQFLLAKLKKRVRRYNTKKILRASIKKKP